VQNVDCIYSRSLVLLTSSLGTLTRIGTPSHCLSPSLSPDWKGSTKRKKKHQRLDSNQDPPHHWGARLSSQRLWYVTNYTTPAAFMYSEMKSSSTANIRVNRIWCETERSERSVKYTVSSALVRSHIPVIIMAYSMTSVINLFLRMTGYTNS